MSTQLAPQLERFHGGRALHTQAQFGLRRVDKTSFTFVLEEIPGLEDISRTKVGILGY